MDARAHANAIIRATRSLADAALRAAYVEHLFRTAALPALARALDDLCARAEQAEEGARETLVAIVDALTALASTDFLQRLREEAAGASLLALDRLVRH